MKKISTLLSHLSSLPQFKVLKQQECYQKYLSLLTPKYQKAIAFIYVKEQTLFIAVRHPGFKMELNYNRDLLKSVLTQLTSYHTECQMMYATKVVVFHSKYHPMPQKNTQESTVPLYQERAHPDFAIETSDPELKEKFKQIQERIACNRP
jgi:hypothetical protein